ncbi:high affinity immunoglobulin epsilon receptor subunit gamma [Varanus komodoensis]|uniref:high affinity immunoglobulin epsilon receptor subunit gamma n=1 Tax=Varanus komodoensis TaxID=61221 RepID=UPI001CF7A7F6|nr:high affinity immunoglobulin epsilon receptor subunit gamma [Varanus komodoensis]
MKQSLWTALLVLLTAVEAEALKEPQLCYILDGILFVYGIILTLLYCRLKMQYRKKSKPAPAAIYEKVDGLYTGLGSRETEAYETLQLPKAHPRQQPPEEGQLVE